MEYEVKTTKIGDLAFVPVKNKTKHRDSLSVKFIVAMFPDGNDGIILQKAGRDNDLLWSEYLSDCELLIPDNVKGGNVYACKNLRVTNQYYSNNPENPEVSYDLQCDWKLIKEASL